jgi:response regulator RpfG family c-di-GMP phosphodiesterase
MNSLAGRERSIRKEQRVDHTGVWETGMQLAGGGPAAAPPSFGDDWPTLNRFLRSLRESRLLNDAAVRDLLSDYPGLAEDDAEVLAEALVVRGLLTAYQVKRIRSGQVLGLVLGNYRILDWLGSGGMGVVLKAEHVHMKRPVAVKVVAADRDDNDVFVARFNGEMEALGDLHHPNIVLAFDAGELPVPDEPGKVLRYLVMEYVHGVNLERYVEEHGPLPIAVACDFIRQAASGLRHAHEHGLIHRDIKPSNLLVAGGPTANGTASPEYGHGQIKILDFGLARLVRRRFTDVHVTLGTIDYMAPEQARDARSADIRADVFGLGGTLYFLLSGRRPFPSDRPAYEELLARQYETPTPLSQMRPDLPLELEAIVCQMMAVDPNDRYPTSLTLIAALDDFLEAYQASTVASSRDAVGGEVDEDGAAVGSWRDAADVQRGGRTRRALIVSPQRDSVAACRRALEPLGLACAETTGILSAHQALAASSADVVLIDAQLSDGAGLDLCRQLRASGPIAHLKLILLADGDIDPLCDDRLPRGAADPALASRVRLALRLKEAEERADRMGGLLLSTNNQLEQALQQRDNSLQQAQDVLIYAMAKMAELRGQETGGHLQRMQGYVRILAEEAMHLPAFAQSIDHTFVRMIERSVLLHDIGKVAIPDHVLLKPGKLDPEERSIMESHTVLGANLLEGVARQHGVCLAFLQMAVDVARCHHEHYDGQGYPDGLAGDAIPLAARITTIADVYDALRSRLVYKPGLTHDAARRLILKPDRGQFDPALLIAFRNCEPAFEQLFAQIAD